MSVLSVAAAMAVPLAAFSRLRRTWPDAASSWALAVPLALAAAVAILPLGAAGAASAGALRGLRAEPFHLLDPDRRDTLAHLLAWLPALVFGDAGAVRLVAAGAAGSSALLAFALVRSAGLATGPALAAQAALPAIVVAVAGPARAAHVQALPQALVLLLLVHLVRRLAHLEGARDTAALFGYLALAQAAGAAPALEVALLVAVLAGAEALAGSRRRARRLFTSGALSTAAVLALGALPRLLDWPSAAALEAPSYRAPFVPLALVAGAGAVGLTALPRGTGAPRVLAAGIAAALAAAVLAGAAALDAGRPGLGLLAPAAACGLAALTGLSFRTSAARAPGSRS
ncbi:MAG TPA: hypothetical protein VIG50_04970 [Vicinamibacteria bacterium]